MEQDKMAWIVHTYSPSLLRAAFLYLKNAADAEDAVQDVFLSYWERQPAFENEAARKAWLYKSVCNRCRDKLRSGWFRHRAQLTEDLSYLPPEQSELLEALLSMDEKYRIPLHLHYYEGYTIKEIAAILKLPPATVGSRLSRGRAMLKQILGGNDYEII
ncbi:MAG: sigma-70 family RNA polymerase sigma factor [Oscillospiraceae bacterium]|nr:sigma-70 family RNA polymerase sigma factor [Oscillospiraceae bacterium]